MIHLVTQAVVFFKKINTILYCPRPFKRELQYCIAQYILKEKYSTVLPKTTDTCRELFYVTFSTSMRTSLSLQKRISMANHDMIAVCFHSSCNKWFSLISVRSECCYDWMFSQRGGEKVRERESKNEWVRKRGRQMVWQKSLTPLLCRILSASLKVSHTQHLFFSRLFCLSCDAHLGYIVRALLGRLL